MLGVSHLLAALAMRTQASRAYRPMAAGALYHRRIPHLQPCPASVLSMSIEGWVMRPGQAGHPERMAFVAAG
jgi:hypothetical protein